MKQVTLSFSDRNQGGRAELLICSLDNRSVTCEIFIHPEVSRVRLYDQRSYKLLAIICIDGSFAAFNGLEQHRTKIQNLAEFD